MKNKLQQKICAIFQRTINAILHIFSKLCVSLKRDNSTTEKDLCEKENCGKFGHIILKFFQMEDENEKLKTDDNIIDTSLITIALSGATGGAMIGVWIGGLVGGIIGGVGGTVISGYSEFESRRQRRKRLRAESKNK